MAAFAIGALAGVNRGGLGMGLAISRSIVEDHGGRIWASIDPALGTVFQFTLPSRLAQGLHATDGR